MPPIGASLIDVVLLGAGDAHVEVLRRFALRPEPRIRLSLIAREPYAPCSGMLAGLIGGDYQFDEAHIDLAPLASASGARLILAETSAIDFPAGAITVTDRPPVGFDLLSIDIGGIPLAAPGGVPIKPIAQFLDHLNVLERSLPDGARIAVVGGGAASAELALALARRLAGRARLALVSESQEPVASAPARARTVVRTALVDAGVELICGVRAGALSEDRLALSDGSFIGAHAALWATGVSGPAFLAASGLACDDAGCVRVANTLRSLSHSCVFAAGDCAAVETAPRAKAGVWTVGAGAVLAQNLRRAASRRVPKPWHPRREALVIMGLGEGRGLAWRNGIALWGSAVWHWKDRNDRRWMRRYALTPTPAPGEAFRCGGAAARLADDLPSAPDPVLQPPLAQAVVQSVSHFRACLDDPFIFGEIATVHALTALYATGARPRTAIAVASIPYMPAAKMQDDLALMLRGAQRILAADGCSLVGVQSTEGLEAALGFALTGLVEPRRRWRVSGLRSSDALVLTKPLGTGVLLAGHMRGLTRSRWLLAAIDAMRRSNVEATRILGMHAITACTEVGSHGLAGHLMKMLNASGIGAVIVPEHVPLLPGALELATRGVESTRAEVNRRVLEAYPSQPLINLLADPQTSGGLLAGIPATRAESCLTALRCAGFEAAIIGVTEGDFPQLRLAAADELRAAPAPG